MPPQFETAGGDAASRQPTPGPASGANPADPDQPLIPIITSDITSDIASVQSQAQPSPVLSGHTVNGIANHAKQPTPSLPLSRPSSTGSGPRPTVPAPGPRHPPPPSQHGAHQPHSSQPRPSTGRSDHRTKPLIVDPPGTLVATGVVQSSGIASPDRDHASNPKFEEDLERLTYAVKQSVPEAVRRVVRDNWEKCLLGSPFQQAFVMNATVHRANPLTFKRSIKDFGHELVTNCRKEIVEHFHTKDLDDPGVLNAILDRASNHFLDRCLEKRLASIEAKPLINALARAERLGYERDDIVEEQGTGHGEKVIPHDHLKPQQQQPAVSHQMQTPVQQPLPQQGRWQCHMCARYFAAQSAHDHHVRKTVCKRLPPGPEGFKHICPHCGQGFTTQVGLNYHTLNKVCGDFGTSAAPPATQPAFHPPAYNTLNGPNIHNPRPPSTPTQSIALNTVQANDPYSHLTPEQSSAMKDELQQAEIRYGDKFRAAEEIVDPDEKRIKLDSLRNSFGTKQSMIRKKYGVRLRERRTKAEIEAEKSRMGRNTPGGTPSSSAPAASAWKAANTPQMGAAHDAKRRRIESGSAVPNYSSPLANGASPLVHKAPNGFAGASRSVTPAAKVYEQAGARVEVHLPAANDESAGNSDEMEDAINQQLAMEDLQPDGLPAGHSVAQAIDLDDDDDDDDEEDSDDDDDIPAELPAAVRMSLQKS